MTQILLLTVAQAAKRLNVSEDSVRRAIYRGDLARVKIGSSVRIHPRDLEAYITANTNTVRHQRVDVFAPNPGYRSPLQAM